MPKCDRRRRRRVRLAGRRRHPTSALEQLVIYEVHVKGFTAHPSSGVQAAAAPISASSRRSRISQRLGVNAVELLPVHEYYVDDFLSRRGSPTTGATTRSDSSRRSRRTAPARTPGCQVAEFKTLVRELHKAGIKVILDVVYNHTGEGNEMGPSLSLPRPRQPGYYSLTGPADAPRRYYMNYTGCGNSLNFDSPAVIRLVMDSLRYWVEVMHVDGFRFDLASVLGRAGQDGIVPRRPSPFFDAVSQDPVLNRVDPDRRAVGHRHLSGRQLPRRLVRMERQVPRHGALASARATPASSPTWAGG